jgi:glucose/mannose-6-phosphate isomerase
MDAELEEPEVPGAVSPLDPSEMIRLASGLGDQLRDGFRNGRRTEGLPSAEGIRSIAVCGMGGSGVAGDLVQALFAARLPFPIVVVKGYVLPEFCGRDTLVIAVSFSGETEETLAVYREAVARGCRVVAISRGGTLEESARSDQVAYEAVPPSLPSVPRAALGYLAGSVIGVLDALGVVPHLGDEIERTAGTLAGLARELGPGQVEGSNEAKGIADWLGGRTPIVWGSEGIGAAAALRWKNQFNENAKVPAFWNAVPELDHNEIEAWSVDGGGSFGAVILRHPGEHPRNALRMAATAEAAERSGLAVRAVNARGADGLEWLFTLIMVGDFVSTYLAILRGVDPFSIPVLTGLKERLLE